MDETRIAFFGHFSCSGSYKVVCRQILSFLKGHDIEVQPYCFATDEPNDGVENYVRNCTHVLLFDFPTTWQYLRSEFQLYEDNRPLLIGYHICDVDRVPQEWVNEMNRLDRVLTPSSWCKNVFRKCGVSVPIQVVHHGVDPDVFRPTDGSPIHNKIVHYCSSFDPSRKGTAELIEAMEMARPEKTELDIITSSSSTGLKQKIERWVAVSSARDLIAVHGRRGITPEEIAKEYRSYKAVVCPSRAEGFGLIPLEAMACGVPVVTTEVTGQCDYIYDLMRAKLYDNPSIVRTEQELLPCGNNGQGGSAQAIDVQRLAEELVPNINKRELTLVSNYIRTYWAWSVVLQPLLNVFCKHGYRSGIVWLDGEEDFDDEDFGGEF